MSRIILPKNLDLLVVSYGGSGTSFLIEFLAKHKTTNSMVDDDAFKHLPLPPISFNSGVKYIYIHGDPKLAAISLFNRNYHHGQSLKLQRWIDKSVSPIPLEMTLHEYASAGVDQLCFENHFDNWYQKYLPSVPTLFIRYETMFEHIETLLEFAGIPSEYAADFPRKRVRKAGSEIIIDKETDSLLEEMYRGFSTKLAKLDDLEIRQRRKSRVVAPRYLNPSYRRALTEEIAYDIKGLLRSYLPKTYQKCKSLCKRTGYTDHSD